MAADDVDAIVSHSKQRIMKNMMMGGNSDLYFREGKKDFDE